jgi:hypothetical protein
VAYATVDQLTDYPVTVPAGVDAELLLRRASRDIDQALLTAIYDPTDPAVVTALMEATCEQVAGILDSGDRTGTGAATPAASFSIGKVSVQRSGGSASQASQIGPLWPRAWQILQQAGLTGQGPQTW